MSGSVLHGGSSVGKAPEYERSFTFGIRIRIDPRTQQLEPRKAPRQARSLHTVGVILEATLRVLIEGGLERLTTTRVAERAGVSVGSLYQYFPNKQSLLAAVLERHLLGVVEAVERACDRSSGAATDAMARELVAAFVTAKLEDPATSAALYAVAAEVGGAEVVARLSLRGQRSVSAMLETASDRRFADVQTVGFMVLGALVGPVQAVLATRTPRQRASLVRDHLQALVASYLRSVGTAHGVPATSDSPSPRKAAPVGRTGGVPPVRRR